MAHQDHTNPINRLSLISLAAAQDCNESPFTDYGQKWSDDNCASCSELVSQYISSKLDRSDAFFEYQASCEANPDRKSQKTPWFNT